jgi:hypothetical protein
MANGSKFKIQKIIQNSKFEIHMRVVVISNREGQNVDPPRPAPTGGSKL